MNRRQSYMVGTFCIMQFHYCCICTFGVAAFCRIGFVVFFIFGDATLCVVALWYLHVLNLMQDSLVVELVYLLAIVASSAISGKLLQCEVGDPKMCIQTTHGVEVEIGGWLCGFRVFIDRLVSLFEESRVDFLIKGTNCKFDVAAFFCLHCSSKPGLLGNMRWCWLGEKS
ncbi:lycopene epsilon-cyclase [Trifolium repens]|nr:lycopene epsilon-cyclase [Trifolium repens]